MSKTEIEVLMEMTPTQQAEVSPTRAGWCPCVGCREGGWGQHRVHPDDVRPGMPATYYIGSDSYPGVVVRVDLFKSGFRKGKTRNVWVMVGRGGGWLKRFHRVRRYDDMLISDDNTGSLSVGHAIEYRDPSF